MAEITRKTENDDIRTDFERAREERWDEIAERFVTLKEMNPLAKPCRLCGVIAKERGMSVQGVRRICVRTGVYQPEGGGGRKAREAGEARS
ncbi:MAG: hypothetical protein LUC24_03385 [Bacteroidales bacterium]|nr:hypothetical protein [Bacteroidales bacterium]